MTIRELLVELGVDADTEEAQNFTRSIASARAQMQAAVAAGAAVAAAIAGVTAAAAAAAFEVGRYSKQLLKNARQVHANVEQYQALQFALREHGLAADDASDFINELSVRMKEASNNTGPAAGKFEELGIQIQNADGSLRSANAVFTETIRKLGEIDNKTRRAALAEKLLGGEFQKLMPLIADGVDSIEEARKKMEAFGILMSEEAAQSAKDFYEQWRFLKRVVMGVVREFGVAVIPVFEALIDKLLAWIKANRDLISTGIRKFARGLAMMFGLVLDAISPLDGLFQFLVRHMQAVAAVMGGVLLTALGAVAKLLVTTWIPAAWSAVAPFAPLIAVVAAASVVVWDLINVMQTGESAILSWLKSFDALRPIIQWVQNNLQAIGAVLATVGAAVAAYLFPFWAAVAGIAAVLADVVNVLMGGNSVIVGFIEQWAVGRQIIDGVRQVVGALGDVVEAVFERLRRLASAWTILGTIASAIMAPIIGYFRVWWRMVERVARVLMFSFRVAFALIKDAALDVFGAIMRWGKMLLAALVPIFARIWSAFQPVAQMIGQLWSNVMQFIMGKIDQLVAGFEYIRQKVSELVGIELGSKTQTIEQQRKGAKKGAAATAAAGERAAAGAAGRARTAAQSGPGKVENKTEVGEIKVEGADDPEETAKKVREEIRKREEEAARNYGAQKRGQEAGQRGGGTS